MKAGAEGMAPVERLIVPTTEPTLSCPAVMVSSLSLMAHVYVQSPVPEGS